MGSRYESQVAYYRSFLMGSEFDPRTYGIDMDRDAFVDLLVDEFGTAYRGGLTIDELLLHPREALRFCDSVRSTHGFYGLPDEPILRLLLNRRKNPRH